MHKKLFAELIGTFALAAIVGFSLVGEFSISTAVLAGLTLGLFVYTIGAISGSHINPAVTIGAWSIGKIKTPEAIQYIVAQFIGAGIALFVLGRYATVPELTVTNDMLVWCGEIFGAVFFTFGVASVIYGKVKDAASGLVIGGSLMLGIAFAALVGSNGVINPAVALTIDSFNVAYIVAPLIGAVIGMWLYKFIQE